MIFINAHVELTNNQFEPRHVFEHPKSFTHLKMLPFLSPLLWKHLNKLGRGLNLTRATGDRFWFNQYIFATKTGASQRFTTLKTWNPRSFGLAIPMCPWNNDDDSNVFPGSNSGLVPWFKTQEWLRQTTNLYQQYSNILKWLKRWMVQTPFAWLWKTTQTPLE